MNDYLYTATYLFRAALIGFGCGALMRGGTGEAGVYLFLLLMAQLVVEGEERRARSKKDDTWRATSTTVRASSRWA